MEIFPIFIHSTLPTSLGTETHVWPDPCRIMEGGVFCQRETESAMKILGEYNCEMLREREDRTRTFRETAAAKQPLIYLDPPSDPLIAVRRDCQVTSASPPLALEHRLVLESCSVYAIIDVICTAQSR